MNRREFLQTAGALAVVATAAPIPTLRAADKPAVTARHLPRWRGFNLLQKFVKRRGGNPPYLESDFALVQEWGSILSACRCPIFAGPIRLIG
jgi:hypothetical protein